MSVLDDIKDNAQNAHQALDDAKTVLTKAADEAEDLQDSAASHGWAGVANAMSSAQESLGEAIGAIDDGLEAISDSLRDLGEITEEMSSDEVSRRLGAIGSSLEGAGGAVTRSKSAV